MPEPRRRICELGWRCSEPLCSLLEQWLAYGRTDPSLQVAALQVQISGVPLNASILGYIFSERSNGRQGDLRLRLESHVRTHAFLSLHRSCCRFGR